MSVYSEHLYLLLGAAWRYNTVCEGREWTFCLRLHLLVASPAASVRASVLFSLFLDNYIIPMSLLTPFCFVPGSCIGLLKEMSRNPTNSFLSILCRHRQLSFAVCNHIYFLLIPKIGRKLRNIFQTPAYSCSFFHHAICFYGIWLFMSIKSNK